MIAKPRSTPAAWAAAAVAMTLVAVLLYANLTSPDQPVEHAIAHRYSIRDSQFLRTMTHLLGPPVVPGNRVTTLLNGDQAFPAMLEAIRSAERSINLEAYIFWSGEVGKTFADALSERARAGVATHVLVDWIGSGRWTTRCCADAAGGSRSRAIPPAPLVQPRALQQPDPPEAPGGGRPGRVHRRAGYRRPLPGPRAGRDHWRDAQFRAEGPVVGQMQAAFLDNWIETGGALLDGAEYFPKLDSVGTQAAQAVQSSPGGGTENLRLMYLLAIASASRSILIANSYFVPNSLAVAMLVDARRRGVDVEIIVPGPISRRPGGAPGFPGEMGAAARGGRKHLRVPADDVPHEGDGRGRLLGLGGFDQLRQPLVPPQRRGEPERLR